MHVLIALAMGNGLDITIEQFGMITAAVASLLALITRFKVPLVAGARSRTRVLAALLLVVVFGGVGPIIWDVIDGNPQEADDPNPVPTGVVDEVQ